MEVHFTPEQEARLAQIATNAGRLVKDAALRLLDKDLRPVAQPAPVNHELPVWHLGALGPLHRRDIYDEAR